MLELGRIVSNTRAYACLDCGKCTGACPVSRYDPEFSPRKLVNSAVRQYSDLPRNTQLYSCVTCGVCEERCQSGVRYTDLVKSLRSTAYTCGNTGQCTHGGALRSLMHIMTAPDLRQDRLGWMSGDLRTVVSGADVLYFTGCAPYFDVIFADIGVQTLASARGALQLLNAVGIVPSVLPNERCCGHDLLWAGETDRFRMMAEYNVKAITAAGARQVVTSCPECYHTLKVEYPRVLGNVGFEVVHLSQMLAKSVVSGVLEFGPVAKKVTYQDPCRLGRFSGIYAEPRAIIGAIPGLEFREMERSMKNALCCGTQAWINCGAVNRQIQNERLREAQSTDAEVLLTFCPKCQIHLKCAQSDKRLAGQPAIDILDLTSLAAGALSGLKTGQAVCEVPT